MFTPDTSHAFFQAPETVQPKTLEEALEVIASLTAARNKAVMAWAAAIAQSEELVKSLETSLEENFKLNSRLYDFLPIAG